MLSPASRSVDTASGCFAIFEHLNMGGRASPERAELMGVQLAQMHRSLSPNGKYGFHVDNTIGGTYVHRFHAAKRMAIICFY